MSSSFEREGCILDYGTHGFHRSKIENQPIVDRMVQLMGPDFIELRRKAAIHFKGRYFNYPLKPKDIFFGLNPLVSALCLADFLATRFIRRLGIGRSEHNFEDWVKNRFGRRLYNIYFGPYTEKVWGIPPSQLTLSWAAQRIPSLSLWAVLKKALLGKVQPEESDEHSHSPYREMFYYTDKGAKLMWDKVAARVEECGGVIRLGTEATELNCDRNLVRSINITQDGKVSRVYCDWVVSTIPVTGLMEMLHPSPEGNVLEKVHRLKFRAMAILYIVVRKRQVTPYQWVYYSSDDVFFNRLSEFKNLTPALMPPDKTVLCLETTCFEGDDIWNASEETVYAESIRSLESLGLVERNEVETYFLVRLPHAYPVADLEYERHYPEIMRHLDGYPNLLSVGRQGAFKYLNMDQSMEEGFEAARVVMSKRSQGVGETQADSSTLSQGDKDSGTD
jgi:protoporphyrinogen oxidase